VVPRFSAQGSVLSIHGDPTKPLKVRQKLRITIDRNACYQLMKRLDDAGLNVATIYPGHRGAGEVPEMALPERVAGRVLK
jgi:hypothetical protein